ncbi:MAG: hypothetical protein KGO53_14600 [Alphaproteobacteria bacterium]|nr:hypothetical protein [Alphaproteobacteria bacterium]
MTDTAYLDDLVTRALAALEDAPNDAPPPPETSFRERFYELVVLALGNLFPRMPNSGQIYDRTTLNRIVMGMDDGDAANLGKRTDDWMRLEGIIKQEEGKRSYYLPLATQAALSANTASGLLGDVCAEILKRYIAANPSDSLRSATRALGAAVMQILGKA